MARLDDALAVRSAIDELPPLQRDVVERFFAGAGSRGDRIRARHRGGNGGQPDLSREGTPRGVTRP